MADHGMWFLPCCYSSLWIYIISFFFLAYISSTFRFYIKCLFLLLYYIILIVIVIFLFLLWSPRSNNNFHKVSNLLKWTEWIWGIQYNVKGLENYKDGSNYIIVSNHQSSFDMNVVSNFIPPKTTFLAKKDVLYVPFIGMFVWLCGVFLIDRNNHGKAINTMKKAADQIKKDKFNLWIFPEGTRHMGNKLLPFKKGAFHLAQQTQLPILPVVISNYENIVNFSRRKFNTGTIEITILPEVPTEGLESNDVENLTNKVYLMMSKEYEK
ncbi:uncharacterized protein LOC114533620 isoform X2 [Dendronephthya gigantea]|uniref:uncharacterized protein LOC114533620 isoform X2 n=1 Tax=Dendronephthya gigantea TaxID=151771 RepID=UPI00106BC397|nr:uncharacterized protein LOC114533620 isoform X2 [Dendronephthya gigantea]